MLRGNIFTDYYKASLLTAVKNRFDITHKTGSYPIFETLLLNKTKYNVGGLSFQYGLFTHCKANSNRKPQMCISRGTHISGVFVPNIENNLIGYGDVKNTKDAIIVIFNPAYTTIEVFIARGKKNDSMNIYTEVVGGEFNMELEQLRADAKEVFKP